ncbi:MAG: endonuclease MutS2 [Deltaproteobacteria bacterium]|nr:MAG: endonuclease MutS2 [Deltaproteobacteria bacterium]
MADPLVPDKTLADLGWPALVDALAARCHTEPGAARARALAPCRDAGEATQRMHWIEELRQLRAGGEPPPFAGICDVGPLVARTDKGGVLDPPELIAVAEAVRGCARLRRHLVDRREVAPGVAELAAAIADRSHDVAGPILDAFEPDGRLADHASPRLADLRRRHAALHERIVARIKRLFDDPRAAADLQDRYYTQREDRYVVPVRSDAPSRLRGIVHGTSQTGATLYVEPEVLVDLNNRLVVARDEIAAEERRILAELSGYVREDAAAIRDAVDRACWVDVLDAAARLADDLDAHAPDLAGGGALELRAARHPLMVLAGRPCVANDLRVEPGRAVVISGPNAGGKTVALKTIGLAAVMARAGLPIAAAAGSRVPWLRAIHSDIGDDQSLERDLSTFSAHVVHLRDMLADAGPDALFLIDEVAAGTAPEQGAALAQAVLEAMVERGARAVVTTHFEPLKALAARDARFVNAAVGFDLDRLEPTFRLHLGAPGSSGALHVARRFGLPEEVVARAEALLGEGRGTVEALLAEAQAARAALDREREQVDRLRAEADADRRAAAAARADAEARLRRIAEGAHGEAVDALRRARAELDAVRRRVRRDPDGADGAAAQVDALARAVRAAAPAPPAASGAPPDAAELRPGTHVVVTTFGGAAAQVVDPPRGGKLVVRVGSARMTVPVDAVRLAPPARRRRTDAPPRTRVRRERAPDWADRADDQAPARTVDNTLDLRGERVDDALARLERFLDDCILAERDVVFVVHGHGTGALRDAVRREVGAHPVVARWRPGDLQDGGDGVTVCFLRT